MAHGRGRGITDMTRNGTLIFALAVTAMAALSCGPTKHLEDKIQWHALKEVQATFPKGPRPIFFYISQTSCENCDAMNQNVFSRPEVAWFLNTNYFAVNFDIDKDLPAIIAGQLYNRTRFFTTFTDQIPTYVFFDTSGNVTGMFQANMDLKSFKQYLKYMHYGHFGKTEWTDFLKTKEAETDTVLGIF
jgi:thioredoxin-related protein